MSVNIYDGTNLTPIAGKTVPMPYTPAPQSMIGDAWVTSHAYAVGDYCIDGNVLYKCKTAHTSSASNRPPYASYWDAVSVSSQLKEVYEEGEVKIGTFLGKDLYRRVIKTNISISQNTTAEYSYPFSKIDGHIINIYAILDNTSNVWFASNSSNTSAVGCWYSRTENKIKIFQNMASTTIAYAIVIEYVKENWT